MNHSKCTTGKKLQAIRLDEAGKHKGEVVTTLQKIVGIVSEYRPTCAPQSIGKAERLVQEISLRAWVMLTNTGLLDSLWAEAIHYGNNLQNRLPSNAVNIQTPISLWKPHAQIFYFTSIPTFGQQGFAFIYRQSTTENRKLLDWAEQTYFIEVQGDKRLCCVFNS